MTELPGKRDIVRVCKATNPDSKRDQRACIRDGESALQATRTAARQAERMAKAAEKASK